MARSVTPISITPRIGANSANSMTLAPCSSPRSRWRSARIGSAHQPDEGRLERVRGAARRAGVADAGVAGEGEAPRDHLDAGRRHSGGAVEDQLAVREIPAAAQEAVAVAVDMAGAIFRAPVLVEEHAGIGAAVRG